jgi:NADPH:quinone reductase-like Zn-dependent oxidoreductase
MKAIVISDRQEPIQIIDREIPQLKNDEVLVKIYAAALNRRDQWIRQGMYPGIILGTTLGSDGSGLVTEIGNEVDDSWLNKEVIINPNINWGSDPKVQSPDYHILGMPSNGTLAEYVVVKADRLHLKPDHLNWGAAAALPLGGLTAYRAIFHHGHITSQDRVLISGVGGGVAQFAFQFALAVGAEVYVTSSDQVKIERCLQLGAKGGFNYKNENWQSEAIEEAGGFDLVIDSAGGDQLNDFIKMMLPAGRIVFYGATTGMPTKLDVFRMFWNQITIQGSTMGNDEEFNQMLDLVNQFKIHPIIDSIYPFEQALAAFEQIQNGVFGKVIVQINK